MKLARRIEIALLVGAAALPAILIALFIHTYGIDARYYDDWWFFTDLLVRGARGTLTFRDLFAQYNESRTVFPRLFILLLNKLGHGDIRWQYYFSFVLACVTAINLFILSRTGATPLIRRLRLLCLASILIFSPVQYQTWIWGVQIVVFFPIVCLTAALLIVESRLPRWPKVFAAAAVCVFATFSHANGMLLWPLIGAGLAARTLFGRDLWKPAALWVALFIASLAAYFHHYAKPYWTPGFTPALEHPLTTLHFFFALLGMPLGWGFGDHAIAASTFLGIAQVALLAVAVYRILCREDWRGTSLPWLIFSAHVLLTAALTAIGRAGFGVDYAGQIRYTSYSLFITVALVYLLPRAFKPTPKLLYQLLALVAVFFTILTIGPACAQGARFRAKYLAGRAGLHYILVLSTHPQPGDLLAPGDTALPNAAASLNSIGYLHPPLARTTTITPQSSPSPGRLDDVQFTGQSITATGVALLPDRPANAVVIAAQGRSGERVALAIFPLADPSAKGHFTVTLSANFPTGATEIAAYAIDGYTAGAYPLAGTFSIPK